MQGLYYGISSFYENSRTTTAIVNGIPMGRLFVEIEILYSVLRNDSSEFHLVDYEFCFYSLR